MAHSAVERNQTKYNTFNYIIRAKLFKGLKDGTMNIRSIFDDEKIKMNLGMYCNYCGSPEHISLDHIHPVKLGGEDKGENLIYACRTCNSSKGKKDLMEWMNDKQKFLPLMVIRRYLKLTYLYCSENNLLNKDISEIDELKIPYNLKFIPIKFPKPSELKLNVEIDNA